VNPLTKANYLDQSPLVVVAYASPERPTSDLDTEPLGQGQRRQRRLPQRESWPTAEEMRETIARCIQPKCSPANTKPAFKGNDLWNGDRFTGPVRCTRGTKRAAVQFHHPPFSITSPAKRSRTSGPIRGARVLALARRLVTRITSHPPALIASDGPAGTLPGKKTASSVREFNSFGFTSW